MGKIGALIVFCFILLGSHLRAVAAADIYTLTAWHADGRLDKELQTLGKTTRDFFKKSGSIKNQDQITYSLTADGLRQKIRGLQKKSVENRRTTGNEQVLVVSISTHGWVYNNQHYLSVEGGAYTDIRTAEKCVTQYDYTQTDTECGLLSSGELGEIFQNSGFDKIIFLTSACFSGQIIEDFKVSSLIHPKIVVIASTDKDHVALAGVFEEALEKYFNKISFEQFAKSTVDQILAELKRSAKLIVTIQDLSIIGLAQSQIFFQQTHMGKFGLWYEGESILGAE